MNRVALVTGAARGIGAATVLALATDGWSVLAVDAATDDPALPYPLGSKAELSEVVGQANRLAGTPEAARSFLADVRDQAALADAVAAAEDWWGGLDAAIAVAGVIAGAFIANQIGAAKPNQQLLGAVTYGGFTLGGLGAGVALARTFAVSRLESEIPAVSIAPMGRDGWGLAVQSAF